MIQYKKWNKTVIINDSQNVSNVHFEAEKSNMEWLREFQPVYSFILPIALVE
jgi:hypothetical protein